MKFRRVKVLRRSIFRLFILIFAALLLPGFIILISGCDDKREDPDIDTVVEKTVPDFSDPTAKDEDCPKEETDDSQTSTADPGIVDTTETTTPQDINPYSPNRLPVISDGDYLLALVTKETTLKSTYRPDDLRSIPAYMYPSRELYLREEALNYLIELWQAAEADGVTMHILSAYRSYDYQKSLFESYAERHGEEEANRFSARPGQSEHQLGTAVDFGGTSVDFRSAFADTPQGRWLAENAFRFGFVMSYPENTEHITGYIFEPWHYRFIGVDNALEWKMSGKTLKEYLESKPQLFE